MTITLLRSSDKLSCEMSYNLDLFDCFLMIRFSLYAFGKTC